MRTEILKSTIKAILSHYGHRETSVEVAAIEEHDKEYLILIRDEIYVPYEVFKYLKHMGYYGVKLTDGAVGIYFRPDVPNFHMDEHFALKVGKYFDKLYPTLTHWTFCEQDHVDGYSYTAWQMLSDSDCWTLKQDVSRLKLYENIRLQLEHLTGSDWELIEIEMEDDKKWVRYDLKEVLHPKNFNW